MKTLLISPNIETLPDPVFPIGLAYIAACLEKADISYEVLDLCFAEDYEIAVTNALKAFQPDIIGLSLRNIDNVAYPNSVSYLPFFKRVIEVIRKNSRAVIVLGGSGFDIMPESILKFLEADFGIVGEGEKVFVELIKRVEKGVEDIRTLRSKVFNTRFDLIENLDDLPLPDRTEFDNKAYLERGGMGNVQTKRGCPFKCIYCTYPMIQGTHVRVRNPKRVCDEIEMLADQGISHIFIVDNEFNYPLEHAQAVCQEIIKRKVAIKWSSYCHPKFVTQKLVELMLEAGSTGMEFGSDAADDMMLKNMGKNFSVNDLRKASETCGKSNMPFCHSLLLGGPGETMATVKNTLCNIKAMSPTAVICMVGIRVFPGTALFPIAMEEGLSPSPQTDLVEPAFYLSPDIKDEILPFLKVFSKENPTWIFPGMNINISEGLQKKLRRFGIKGPLWEYMKMGKKMRKSSKQ